MDKDAYYFPHFSNSRNDRKVKRMRKELGVEGYGIFFMLLEVIRDQADFKYPLEDIDLLADEFNTSEQKVRVVVCNYNLFEIDENEKFFSPKFIEFMQPYLKMKEQRSLAGKASAKARKIKKLERPLNDRSTTDEQSKVKESKVNNIKNNTNASVLFLEWFNKKKLEIEGKDGRFKVLSKTDERNLKKLKKSYTEEDFNTAIASLYESKWARENNSLTPAHFLRIDNFNKYLNQTESKKNKIYGL